MYASGHTERRGVRIREKGGRREEMRIGKAREQTREERRKSRQQRGAARNVTQRRQREHKVKHSSNQEYHTSIHAPTHINRSNCTSSCGQSIVHRNPMLLCKIEIASICLEPNITHVQDQTSQSARLKRQWKVPNLASGSSCGTARTVAN